MIHRQNPRAEGTQVCFHGQRHCPWLSGLEIGGSGGRWVSRDVLERSLENKKKNTVPLPHQFWFSSSLSFWIFLMKLIRNHDNEGISMSWLMAGPGILEQSRCVRMLRVICSGRCRSCSRNSPAVSSLWTDSKLLENISVLLQPPKICTKQRWERIIYAPIPCPAQVFCPVHTWFGKNLMFCISRNFVPITSSGELLYNNI